ncbi:MAG: hypothetical protein ACI35P_03060 [Bacillus sp. (in: firmicutes)]
MSGSQLAQWWNTFYSSFSSVSSFFFNKVFRSIADILLDSKIIVFTAVFVACAAVSAVVYIVLNSRSDSFEDGLHEIPINGYIRTPNMLNRLPENYFRFFVRLHNALRRRRSKKEAEANRKAAEEARERDRAEAEGFANEYFERNQTRMTVSYNGFKFYAPNWYKRNWGNTHKIRTTQYRDRHGNLQVRTSDTVTKDESNEFEQIED